VTIYALIKYRVNPNRAFKPPPRAQRFERRAVRFDNLPESKRSMRAAVWLPARHPNGTTACCMIDVLAVAERGP